MQYKNIQKKLAKKLLLTKVENSSVKKQIQVIKFAIITSNKKLCKLKSNI